MRHSPAQQQLLALIDRTEGGYVSSPNQVSVKALVRKGYIKSQPGPARFLAFNFIITEEGKAALAALKQPVNA